MADHPLRPATDRSLGRPLPHQLANQTQDPLLAPGLAVPRFHRQHPSQRSHAVLPLLSERYSPQRGRFPTRYSPVCHAPCGTSDLHVLGTPPAFILSQDQTLMFNLVSSYPTAPKGARLRLLFGLTSEPTRVGTDFNAFPFSLSGFQRRPNKNSLRLCGPVRFPSVCHNLDRGRHSGYYIVTRMQQLFVRSDKFLPSGARQGWVPAHQAVAECL